MKIVCMVCPGAVEIEESKYLQHMTDIHGGSQATGKLKQQNVPPLPAGVTVNDLPTPEFLKTVEEMEKAKMSSPPPKPMQPILNISKPIQQEIKLTYKYVGNCEIGHSVATLETDVENKHFAIAYCLQCNKQIESREVASLTSSATVLSVSAEEVKAPAVVAKPSALPPSAEARLNDKPHKNLTAGVKKTK